jgi:hypothetical protein
MNRADHSVPPLNRVLDRLAWFAGLIRDHGR